MDGKIIFCNDGVLRFKSDSDESQVIPLVSIQESLKIPSHRFFLQNLTKIAILEKGSTMGFQQQTKYLNKLDHMR